MIDVRPVAAKAHHAAHMRPVADLLGVTGDYALRRPEPASVALVASYGDLARVRRAGYRRIVLMQHGAGQSYGGDRKTARHPAYPGGDDNDDVGLFLCPNEHSANRWRERYPAASVRVVGCPKIDSLPQRAVSVDSGDDDGSLVVAVSFHWNYHGIPEMRSAFDHWWPAVARLAERMKVIGHAHPKRHDLKAWYPAHGIEWVPDFDDVLRRADMYVCDNSSSLFEFASTGRPVVVLDAPWYRPEADHGLRFWDAADVGQRVQDLDHLEPAVRFGDARPPWVAEQRLALVYAHRGDAARCAADAVLEWAA